MARKSEYRLVYKFAWQLARPGTGEAYEHFGSKRIKSSTHHYKPYNVIDLFNVQDAQTHRNDKLITIYEGMVKIVNDCITC